MNIEDSIGEFRSSVDAFVEKVEAADPALYEKAPAPGEWSITEIAAHTAEIFAYWAGQFEHLYRQPGSKFGRTADDAGRARFVETHRHTSMDDLIRRIRIGEADAIASLRAFGDDQWTTVSGIHPARGEMTVEAAAKMVLLDHAQEHLKQVDDTIAKLHSA